MQRIKEFVLNRKRPVTIEDIMDRFLVSRTTAYKAVNSLLSEGRLRRVRKNSKTYFEPNPEGNRPSGSKGARGKSLFLVRLVEAVRSRQAGN